MRIPEIYALIRKVEGSNAEDRMVQQGHFELTRELCDFVRSKNMVNAIPFAEAASALLQGLASDAPLVQRKEVLRVVCRLLLLAGYALATPSGGASPNPMLSAAAARPVPRGSQNLQDLEMVELTEEPPPEARLTEPPPGHPELAGINRMVLGRILVELEHISEDDLEKALAFHRERQLPLGECMLLLNLTKPDCILQALRVQEGMHAADSEAAASDVLAKERQSLEPQVDAALGASVGSTHFEMGPQMFFGELLLATRKINGTQLEEAMHRHHHDGLRVGEALVAMGALTDEDIRAGLRLQKRLREIAGFEPVSA